MGNGGRLSADGELIQVNGRFVTEHDGIPSDLRMPSIPR